MCTTIEWPPTAFCQAANGGALQVPTLENLDALFDVDPQVNLVGPFAGGEVRLILTQNVMCMPPKYVSILLGQGLTLREAYLWVCGAIQADGNEADCGPLLLNYL